VDHDQLERQHDATGRADEFADATLSRFGDNNTGQAGSSMSASEICSVGDWGAGRCIRMPRHLA
jgi:hypothetical protein